MGKDQKHRIPDKGEIDVDFADKFYKGSFGPRAQFSAAAEGDGLLIKLMSPADRREVQIHLHHGLMAEILHSWADSLKEGERMSAEHKKSLKEALREVARSIR